MRKQLLPIWILLCLIPGLGLSQVSISIEPENFVMSGKPTETNIYVDVDVINTSGQMVNLLWSKRLNNGPAEWLTWVCDINKCYDPDRISCPENLPNPIAPGDTIAIQMHLNPRGIEGSGEYQVSLVDLDGTTLGTITGNVQVNLTSSSSQAEKDNKLTVYPNPASDYFHTSNLPGLKTVDIFNLLGNKVKSMDAAPQKQYYVGDLSEGIYLVRLIGASNTILKTVRLSIE